MGENNQPQPLVDYNLFTSDLVLTDALDREGARWAQPSIQHFGKILGTEQVIRLGFEANENPPVPGPEDRVEFHPAWHELMRLSIEHGLHGLPWQCPRPG